MTLVTPGQPCLRQMLTRSRTRLMNSLSSKQGPMVLQGELFAESQSAVSTVAIGNAGAEDHLQPPAALQ